MTLEEIAKEWKKTQGHTEGLYDYRQRLIERQNLIYSLLMYIAKNMLHK